MNKVIMSCFSRADALVSRQMLGAVFSGSSLFREEDLADHTLIPDAAVVNIRHGWEALKKTHELRKTVHQILFYDTELTDMILITIAQSMGISLLIDPYSPEEYAECGRVMAAGKQFTSTAAAKAMKQELLGEFINTYIAAKDLSEVHITMLFGMLTGRENKEIAAVTGKSLHHIEKEAAELKQKYGGKEGIASVTAALGMINYRACHAINT
jgi:DNA-binding NarL/FixJ family response regulator